MNAPQEFNKPGLKGFARIVAATGNSIKGLKRALRSEAALRQELMLVVIAIPLALWLTADKVERSLLIASVVLVFIVELLNTAVECAIDRIGPEYHELSGLAKDVGSAAVLVSLLLVAFVWIMILV